MGIRGVGRGSLSCAVRSSLWFGDRETQPHEISLRRKMGYRHWYTVGVPGARCTRCAHAVQKGVPCGVGIHSSLRVAYSSRRVVRGAKRTPLVVLSGEVNQRGPRPMSTPTANLRNATGLPLPSTRPECRSAPTNERHLKLTHAPEDWNRHTTHRRGTLRTEEGHYAPTRDRVGRQTDISFPSKSRKLSSCWLLNLYVIRPIPWASD